MPHPLTSITDSDDCIEAYEDAVTLDLSEMEFDRCGRSASGYCEYTMADEFKRCIHCGKEADIDS